jgi:hypothetical protein
MRSAAHRQQRRDVTNPETTPNGRRVVTAIPEHPLRPLSGPPAFALQRRNRIHQRQGFLRVVPIRAGQAHGERHASPIANQMTLAPALGPIGGIRAGLVPAVHRADRTTVDHRPRPINLVGACEPIEQSGSNPRRLPVASRAADARGHPRSTPEFTREHLPGNAAAEDKQNAGETRAIGDARPCAFRPMGWSGQERFDKIPQRIGKQRGGHTRSRYLADEAHVSEVLLRALRNNQS